MNRRIEKKIHTKYLSDAGIEVTQDKEWELRLSKLTINEMLTVESGELPSVFFELNPSAKKYKLSYEVKRVEFSTVPTSESGRWQVNKNTTYLAFYPSAFRRSCWYVAINFQS